VCLGVLTLFFQLEWILFSVSNLVGIETYFEKNWVNLMRVSHADEFNDLGHYSCPGGKYLDSSTSNNYLQLDCPLSQSAFMWEETYDEVLYSCLNTACKGVMQDTLATPLFLMSSYMLKLTLTTVLSIGLAGHTTRFQ
jgi:hypothetical protein